MSIRHFLVFGVGRLIPDRLWVQIKFFQWFGRFANLRNPQTFNEKLQWLKLYDRRQYYSIMVDKYASKQYVADKVGREYVIPVLGRWRTPDEIDFQQLPRQFVLKTTHDCGGVVICRDRESFDRNAATDFLWKHLKNNYYLAYREWPYKNVEPFVYAEKYLENNASEGLHDYKVWCFNGKPAFIQYVSGRAGAESREAFYDFQWRRQPFTFHNPACEAEVRKPLQLDKIERLAGELSAGIPFLRVDFYVTEDGSVYVGELTFFPMSGFERFKPEEYDQEFGGWIVLPERK